MSKIASLRRILRRPRHLPTKVNSKRIDDEMGVPYSSYTPAQMGRVGHAIAFAYGDRYTAVKIQDQAISGGEEGRLNARKFLVEVCKEHVRIRLFCHGRIVSPFVFNWNYSSLNEFQLVTVAFWIRYHWRFQGA
jgi:hypothetical protein